MKFFRSNKKKEKKEFKFVDLTPFFLIMLFVMIMYGCFMISYMISVNECIDNNASTLLKYQVYLPEVNFPSDFDGNLKDLLEEEDVLYRITSNNYEKYFEDNHTYLIVEGYLSDVDIVYARVDRDYVLTDGVQLWLFTRPNYWDVSLGKGLFGILPDIFCKYLLLPCCLFVFPIVVETYAKRNKVNMFWLYFIRVEIASGVLLSIVLFYLTTVKILWL